jgi:tRNA A37 N6-isopentenylltransferase MiaA
MDALPLVLNRHQLSLMHDEINQAIEQLQHQNFSTDGINDEEAYSRLQAVDDQLKSHLQQWDQAPEATKPVPISLDTYQIRMLRSSLEQGINQQGDDQRKQQLEDVIEQLPEYSAQEDAD